MNSKKYLLGIVSSLFFIFFAGCNLTARDMKFVPYSIEGKFLCEKDDPNYDRGAIFCNFKNLDEKTVKGIYVVFSLFDDEGIPICQNVIEIKGVIPTMENGIFSVNLDKYLTEDVNENYMVDFLYASKIIYEDNSEWSDPMGLKSFL